jgi:hypothetical protein
VYSDRRFLLINAFREVVRDILDFHRVIPLVGEAWRKNSKTVLTLAGLPSQYINCSHDFKVIGRLRSGCEKKTFDLTCTRLSVGQIEMCDIPQPTRLRL